MEFFITIIATVATALAGFGAVYFSRYAERKRTSEKRDVVSVLEAAKQNKRQYDDIYRAIRHAYYGGENAGAQPQGELGMLVEQLREIRAGVPDLRGTMDMVQELVESYHKQALQQARVQFWFSVIAASVGFGMVLYALLAARDAQTLDLLLRSLPGVSVDAVAALFFVQARETRQRATELYDRLRQDALQAESRDLVETISHAKIRDAVKAQLAMQMMGCSTENLSLNSLVERLAQDSEAGPEHEVDRQAETQ